MSAQLQLRLIPIFLALSLGLSACGGGGSVGVGVGVGVGGSGTAAPAPKASINSTTSYTLQNTPAPTDIGSLLQRQGLSGTYFDARQYIDLDGDGIKEIIVAPGLDGTTATPVYVFRKQPDGSYANATANVFGSTVPGQIHPRKVISADFNGDGLPDLYFVDHGYDHSPFPGAQNVLMLSNKSIGKWEPKTIPNNPTAFQHCATAGDIDNNGTIDIFVCAEGWQGPSKAPYMLVNDGAGNMTIKRDGVPASLSGRGTGMLAAELIDVDGDGFLDLVAGYRVNNGTNESFVTSIFWGDGSGSFSDSRATTLPNPADFVATYDIKAEDIDGDGRRDLVLLRVTRELKGYYLQTLRQTSTRSFADESVARIIKNASSWEGIGAPWFPWIHMSDLNGDGKLDIAIGDSSANNPARNYRWINDGSGSFTKAAP